MRLGRTLVILIILAVWVWCATSGDNVTHHRTGNANYLGLSTAEQDRFWSCAEVPVPSYQSTGMKPGTERFFYDHNGLLQPIR